MARRGSLAHEFIHSMPFAGDFAEKEFAVDFRKLHILLGKHIELRSAEGVA